ncbi:MAG TPA: bacteriohemerythrin [Candidatus Lachnoclostridium pullistercoris]|uniref:Bacteriohemerythrin n=1 Tax=Candidatus Lachnoclostridium pullistercoris TaxID=2838632 RepID=A0A9D2PDU8_9FIRM|nr:bacteriohemerythrin [Candidatus Lachnoclostridium pullistercoris]
MYVTFDDTLVTGNEMIDSQHKEWIDRINQLMKSCETDKEKQAAMKMLDYMADYADFHFGAEEKLQEEIGYPGIEDHKKKHEEFRRTVQELHDMLEEQEGPSDAFVKAVEENVMKWLMYHIQSFDRSVAEYKYMRDNAERL